MQFLKNNRIYIGLILIAILGFLAYSKYFSGGGGGELLSSTPVSPLSQDILGVLSNLNIIRLDNSIFSDPVFISLTDYGVAIPAEQVGRRNPFEPL